MVLLTLKGSNIALAFTYLTIQGDLRPSSLGARSRVKIQRTSKKYTAILHTKTSHKLFIIQLL